MHAAFPHLLPQIQQAMKLGHTHGIQSGAMVALEEKIGGRLIAEAMAIVMKLAFGFLILRDEIGFDAKNEFFNENFVFTDPNAPGGKRYYQGKFLITTRNPEEDMNVLVQFCPEPEKLFIAGMLNPAAVVKTEALGREEAQRMASTPFAVDIIIQFRNISAILGLLHGPGADLVSLLLQNKVQFKGNTGHMFKLGAISASMQAAAGMKPSP